MNFTTDSPVPAGNLQDGKFKKGQSGNPAGRKKGQRNRVTLAVEALLGTDAEAITRKAIELAKDGDITAIRLCMDRIAPTPKDSPIMVDLPAIDNVADIVKASAAILNAVASGEITPHEGNVLSAMITHLRQSMETLELAARIEALEARS